MNEFLPIHCPLQFMVAGSLTTGKILLTLIQPMYPMLAHCITSFTYMVCRTDQIFERLFKVFSEINPVSGIYVQAL